MSTSTNIRRTDFCSKESKRPALYILVLLFIVSIIPLVLNPHYIHMISTFMRGLSSEVVELHHAKDVIAGNLKIENSTRLRRTLICGKATLTGIINV